MAASGAIRVGITGAAGLVGQNLVPRLKARGFRHIVAIDKHAANTATLRRLHPDLQVIEANLARDDGWQAALAQCDVIVLSHAQIGGLEPGVFEQNNVVATRRVLEALQGNPGAYLVHISSSVVESEAVDWYSESKATQERLVLDCAIPSVVLRPTLMFGWFDRKHLAWLARFMQRTPLFPIPGRGRYLRQPLYAGDFCDIVMSCIERRPTGAYNISGREQVAYIDLMKLIRDACGARAPFLPLPYRVFWLLLWLYARFDRDPPFTTKQLEALALPEVFELIDWPRLFSVQATPLRAALEATFRHPVYSKIVLEF